MKSNKRLKSKAVALKVVRRRLDSMTAENENECLQE